LSSTNVTLTDMMMKTVPNGGGSRAETATAKRPNKISMIPASQSINQMLRL